MHHLNIVHLDIKPQNLAYSHYFNRCVFLDFGISRALSQSIGFKTKTAYCGTFSYSSLQLRLCLQKSEFVDLYYNDVYGLIKTIQNHNSVYGRVKKQFKFIMQNQQIDYQTYPCEKQMNAHKNQILKFYLHKEDLNSSQKNLSLCECCELQNSAESLFQYFFPSYFFKSFYYKNFYKNLKNIKTKEKLDNKFKKTTKPTKTDIQEAQIKLKIQMLKDILFYLNQNHNQTSSNIQNSSFARLDLKTILLSRNITKNLSKQVYMKIYLKYVTFQSNKYQASLKDKQQVGVQFLTHFQLQQTTYLGYDLSEPKLLSLVVSIKFIIDSCSVKPYHQTLVQLYPKAWAQFILIHPDICQKKLSKNYVTQIFKTVQDQLHGKQNFYKKLHNYFKIRFASRLIRFRNRQFNYIDISTEKNQQVQQGLYDVQSDLINFCELKTDVFRQFLQLFDLNVKFTVESETIKNNQNPKFQLLQKEIILSSQISKTQKQYFLYKLATQRLFKVFWCTGNTKILKQSIEQVYLCTNFDELNEELMQLCMYYSQVNDVNNCRQIIRIIDQTINCQIISRKLLVEYRQFVQYYSDNRKKAIQYYSIQIKQFKQYQSKNQMFYLNLIKWSSTFVNQRFFNKFKNQPEFQKTNKDILELNQLLMIKIKKCIQKLLVSINQKQNQQKTQNFQYYKLFNFLILSIKYLQTDHPSKKQYLFALFQKYYPKIQKTLMNTSLWRYMQVKTNMIAIKVIQYSQQNNLLQLLIFLYSQIHDDIVNDQYIFEVDNSPAPLYPILKFIQVFSYFKFNYKNLDSICNKSQQNDKQQQEYISFFKQKEYQVRITQLYDLVIQKVYSYFIRSKIFQQTCRSEAPNCQIYLYFYSKSKFQSIFNYMYELTKWVSASPMARLINKFIKQLYDFKAYLIYFSLQFQNSFFQVKFHNLNEWENPYWWLLTSIMCFFLQKHKKDYYQKYQNQQNT